MVLFSAVPCGIIRCGNWFSAAVVTGMITMAVPNIRIALTVAKYTNEVLGVRKENIAEVAVSSAKPNTANHLATKRQNTQTVTGDIYPIMIAPDNSISTSPNVV